MKNSVMPKLRFKEFGGKWESKKIKHSNDVVTGGTPSTLIKEYWDGNIPWMNSGELNHKRVFEVENSITELGLKKSSTKIIPKYSILIGLAGQGKTRGTVAINMIDLCINQSIAAILPNYKALVPDFLYYELDKRYDELRKLSTGDGGRGGLNLQIIKNLSINLPSLAEQEKIAAYLSAIDKKISLLKEKENELQLYKKGIMQKIFSQSLRFKDEEGKEFEEWEEKKLGEVVDNISSGKSKKVDNGKIPLYGSTGIIGFSENSDYCGTKILIARVGANAGYMYKVTGSYGVTDNTLILNVIDNNIDFIHSSLSYINLNRFIFGSGQPLITGGLLKNLLIQLPCVAEQEKIANFLSAIDEKINAVQKQKEAMQAFKKGMLQQLFV